MQGPLDVYYEEQWTVEQLIGRVQFHRLKSDKDHQKERAQETLKSKIILDNYNVFMFIDWIFLD